MKIRHMAMALVVTLAAAAVVCAAAGDWAMARYDEGQTGYTPQPVSLPLTLCWQHNTVKYVDNPSVPAVVGGVVYFASGNRVYAVDATSGALKWRYPSTDTLPFSIKTGITVWEHLLFFGGTDGNLYALTTADGRMQWRFPTRGAIRSTPVVSGGTLFVGSDDNNLYAIDAGTGELSWLGGFRTRDDIIAAPALTTGLVIFASMDTNVYAANVTTGKTRWQFQLPLSPVRSAPVVSGNSVYIAAGRTIFVLSAKNGQLKHSIAMPSDIAAPVAVADDNVYAVCRNRKLYAYEVNLAGPKAKWTAAVDVGLTMQTPPTIAGNVIFVPCNKGLVNAYSTEDGSLLWSYMAAPYAEKETQRQLYTNAAAPVVVANDSLYVLTDDGSLRCFRSTAADNTPPIVFGMIPQMGSAMSGQPPILVSAMLFDQSSGVNPNSVRLMLDDNRVDHEFDVTAMTLTYETPLTSPPRALSDGRHFLTIEAQDWKGNPLSYTWSFLVDNTLPPTALSRAKAREATLGGGKGPSINNRIKPPPPPPPDTPNIPVGPGDTDDASPPGPPGAPDPVPPPLDN